MFVHRKITLLRVECKGSDLVMCRAANSGRIEIFTRYVILQNLLDFGVVHVCVAPPAGAVLGEAIVPMTVGIWSRITQCAANHNEGLDQTQPTASESASLSA